MMLIHSLLFYKVELLTALVAISELLGMTKVGGVINAILKIISKKSDGTSK